MKFLWPMYLWLLLLIPLLVGGYLLLLRRHRRAVRFSDLGLVKEALSGRQFRRHIPPLLFLLAMLVMLLAVSRPTALITLPSNQRTIIMAIDVSLSMRASDVQPSRIVAAQTAAKAFIQDLPTDMRVGIVTFAGTASVAQAPTQNREDLIAAIDRFDLQRHTAIGSGIIVSLATLFPDAGFDIESAMPRGPGSRAATRSAPIESAPKAEKKAFTPVAPGSYSSAAIVLLTDGRRTTGPLPVDAARMAADRGVRVFTVGFGSAAGASVNTDGYSMFMAFDEETLKIIADVTRAEYFHASSAEGLRKVYDTLNNKFSMEKTETEVSALFAAFAALLALAAGLLSLLWYHRVD